MTEAPRDAAERAARVAASLKLEYWFFGEALTLDGLVLAADAYGQDGLADTAAELMRGWAAELPTRAPRPADAFAPLRALIRLDEREPEAGWLRAARTVADYVLSEPEQGGAVLHKLPNYPRPMVFVDYIYYVGPYLGLLAQALDEPEYLDAAAAQTIGHIEALQNNRTGFFDHVFDPQEKEPYGIAWGRGNGWAMLGLVDTLELLRPKHPGREQILEAFSVLFARSFELQASNGHWHAILDDSASPLEPSIAAFFLASGLKARRLGLVQGADERLDRAWDAVLRNFSPNGDFATSMTEWPDRDPHAYYTRPSGVNPWGQGCFLRVLAEILT